MPLMDLVPFLESFTRLVGVYWFTPPLLTSAITGRPLGFSSPDFTAVSVTDKLLSSFKVHLSFRVPLKGTVESVQNKNCGSLDFLS